MSKTKSKTKSKRKPKPAHYTDKGTRKFQSNGPQAWSETFRAACKAAGGTREGQGIHLAMAYAIVNEKAFLKWAAASAKATIAVKGEE